MPHRVIIAGFCLCLMLTGVPTVATAQSGIIVSNNQAILKFPEWITFNVDLKTEPEINRVVLEYGVQQKTCYPVIGKAFPTFTAGKQVQARWTWEMKQTGSEPPGAKIWWRWRVTTSDGKELLTEKQELTWLDDWRPWQVISTNQLSLHWYGGDKNFATELHRSAITALSNLSLTTGLTPDDPIHLYIYANSQDLRDSILYIPSWTGGQAYPNYNLAAIAIETDQLAWGKRAIAHELTHVVQGRSSCKCIGGSPQWLREGLAMYGEGELSAEDARAFQNAISQNKLLSVRALTSSFSESSEKANLSYSQSYSLVLFLISQYGQRKLASFQRALCEGTSIDEAMNAIYNFDSDGLEVAWRAKIGAKPLPASARSISTLTPTFVATYVPIAGLQLPSRTPTVTPMPSTATATATRTPTDAPLPPISTLTLTPLATTTPTIEQASPSIIPNIGIMIAIAFGLLLVIIVVIVIVAVFALRKKG